MILPRVTVTHEGSEDRGGNTVLEEIAGPDKSLSELVLLGDTTNCIYLAVFSMTMSTHAVMFGNPETGRPIPAEQINAVTWRYVRYPLSQRLLRLTMMSSLG